MIQKGMIKLKASDAHDRHVVRYIDKDILVDLVDVLDSSIIAIAFDEKREGACLRVIRNFLKEVLIYMEIEDGYCSRAERKEE